MYLKIISGDGATENTYECERIFVSRLDEPVDGQPTENVAFELETVHGSTRYVYPCGCGWRAFLMNAQGQTIDTYDLRGAVPAAVP